MSGISHKNYKPTAGGLDESVIDDGWQTSLSATPQPSSQYDFGDILKTPFYDSAHSSMSPPESNWTVEFGAPAPTYDPSVFGQAVPERFQTGSIYHPSYNQDNGGFYNQAPLPSIYQQQTSQIDTPPFHGQGHMTMNAGFGCLETAPLSKVVHPQTVYLDGDPGLSLKQLSGECPNDGDGSWRSFVTRSRSPASSITGDSGLSIRRRSPGGLCNPLAPARDKISRPRWKKPRVPGSRKSDPLAKREVVEIPHCTLERYSEYLAKTKLSGLLPTPEELQYRANRQKYRVRELKGFIAWAATESGHTNDFKGTICWECFEYTGKFHPKRKRNDDAACRCESVTQTTLWKFSDTAKVGQLHFPIREFEKTIDMH